MTLTATPKPILRPARAGLSRLTGWLRSILPRGLFIRAVIIVIAPMVLLQAIIAYLFLEDHEARTTAALTRGVIDQIALVVQLTDTVASDTEKERLSSESSTRLGMSVAWLPGEKLPADPGTTTTTVGQQIGEEMAARIPEAHWFDAQRFGEYVDLRVAQDGGTLRFLVERKRFININMHLFPVWMIAFSVILIGVAILFLINQIRPIQRLAVAAEAFGRGRDVPDFRPSGAHEVRRAAIAFIGMKRRLARQMQQRTEMLAGVSHDLRTPLTRMKLELAMMDDDLVGEMKSDVAEMERMLEEYLAFARGEGGEQAVVTDVAQLLTEIADEARRNSASALDVTAGGDLAIPVKRNALKRCLNNLVGNALKYGTHVSISARRLEDEVEIAVDDDGPGIPPERRLEAFKPFRRLDQGRNLERGGVGLGLAIALDIARGHGGDVTLDDSRLGGLRAVVTIPA